MGLGCGLEAPSVPGSRSRVFRHGYATFPSIVPLDSAKGVEDTSTESRIGTKRVETAVCGTDAHGRCFLNECVPILPAFLPFDP